MPLEGLGPPFEGPNDIMFRAGFWKGKPVVLRMSSASSTGYENVFQHERPGGCPARLTQARKRICEAWPLTRPDGEERGEPPPTHPR